MSDSNLNANGSITRAWLTMLANEGHEPPVEHTIEFRGDSRVVVDGIAQFLSWGAARELLTSEAA